MCVSHVPRLLMFARTLLLPSGYQELSPTRDDGRAEVASREVIILRRCRGRPVGNRGGEGTTMGAPRPAREPRQKICSAGGTRRRAGPVWLCPRSHLPHGESVRRGPPESPPAAP